MRTKEYGFTLLEMMVVVLLFTIVTGAVFQLLNTAQQRYRTESQVLDSFQAAREVMDQITREVHSAGYPPPRAFPGLWPNSDPAVNNQVAIPFPSTANGPCPLGVNPPGTYPIGTACQAGVNGCIPGTNCPWPNAGPDNLRLIIEEDLDPENVNGVEWVFYALGDINGNPPGLPPNVLWRRVASKPPNAGTQGNIDQEGRTAWTMMGVNLAQSGFVPVVYNVMNDPAANNQPIGAGCTDYTGNPVVVPTCENEKLFRYEFDQLATTSAPCVVGFCNPTAQRIRTVYINLILRSQDRDLKTNRYRYITLRASAKRYN